MCLCSRNNRKCQNQSEGDLKLCKDNGVTKDEKN